MLDWLVKYWASYGFIVFDESFHTKQTKEEVAGTLEAVQTIQSITQALQKSKENYNAKCVEQERLKKEGATQREIEKVIIIKNNSSMVSKHCWIQECIQSSNTHEWSHIWDYTIPLEC